MKLQNYYHCIQYEYRGKEYISGSFLHYRATLISMAAAFYLSVIDNGFKVSDVINIQFSIDEETVLLAPFAQKVSYLLPKNNSGASIGSAGASR